MMFSAKSVTLAFLLVLHVSQACRLPMKAVFSDNILWMQAISVPDRHLLTVGLDDDEKIIKVKNERGHLLMTYTCLSDHGDFRYKMEIKQHNMDKHVFHQCFKFTPLTARAIRLARSEKNFKEKLNCEQAEYREDAAVLIDSYDRIPTVPCPFTGGFQVLLRETNPPDNDRCMDKGWKENPSFNIECGQSHSAIVQFGFYCVPKVLQAAQKMRRRYLTHLNCVSSWQENDKGNFVLFEMRDMYTTFWCMNYEFVDGETVSVYLTFDGRCTKKPEKADNSSRHGHLIKYIPHSDPRCSKFSLKCEHFDSQNSCYASNDCPGKCSRCIGKRKKSDCRFLLSSYGQWKSFKSPVDMVVDVDGSNFTMSNQGQFECTGFATRHLAGKVYPVVQYSSLSSCPPYHACSQTVSPAPGLFNFFLRPASTENGRITTCTETHSKFGGIIPVNEEKEFTLVDESKLETTTCNIRRRMTFPTHLGNCKFILEKCSGTCKTLHVGLDNETCTIEMVVNIETEHICYAHLFMSGGFHAIVTKSVPKGHFFCWIFTKGNKDLKLAPLYQCNSDSIGILFKYYLDEFRNDPLHALEVESVRYESGGDSDGKGSFAPFLKPGLHHTLLLIILSLLLSRLALH